MMLLRAVLAALLLATPATARSPAPADPAAMNRLLARAASRAGQWPAAARLWRAVTLASPGDAAAWAGLGGALMAEGEAEAAAAALDRAVALGAGDADLWWQRGRAALALQESAMAYFAFAALAAAAPSDPRGWIGLGIAHDRAGNRTAARASWARALALDPLNAAARHNLAATAP